MEVVKGKKYNYKIFKNILDVIVIIMGGFVFCATTFILFRCVYYYINGLKSNADIYKESNQVTLEYAVDGTVYQNDITQSIYLDTREEIYYLKKQPERFCRMIWAEMSIYGYLFVVVLLILRIVLLKLVKVMPSYFNCRKRVTWGKQIISFKKK